MKILIILIISLFWSLPAFSQADTLSTDICLPQQIVRQVARDLTLADTNNIRIQLLYRQVDLLTQKGLTQTKAIENLNNQLRNHREINEVRLQQIQIYRNQVIQLEETLQEHQRKSNLIKTYYRIGVGVLLGIVIIK